MNGPNRMPSGASKTMMIMFGLPLSEEVGEAAQAILKCNDPNDAPRVFGKRRILT